MTDPLKDNVFTHPSFNANVQALRDAGIEVNVAETEDLSDIKLDEPKYGETILGELSMDEKATFVALYRAYNEQERLAREYMGAALSRLGNSIRTSDVNKPLNEAVGEQQMEFGTPENQLDFFRLQARINVLRATLYWNLGERFGAHDWSIGVRSRFRAVKASARV